MTDAKSMTPRDHMSMEVDGPHGVSSAIKEKVFDRRDLFETKGQREEGLLMEQCVIVRHWFLYVCSKREREGRQTAILASPGRGHCS